MSAAVALLLGYLLGAAIAFVIIWTTHRQTQRTLRRLCSELERARLERSAPVAPTRTVER